MGLYTSILRPLLFRADPERIHHLSMALLTHTPAASLLTLGRKAPSRPVNLWGLEFRNPLGLAAGFDKDGLAMEVFYHLGFGFTEIGTATYLAQSGNPRPRVFRCPSEKGLINRMGFPNDGAAPLARRIRRWRRDHPHTGYPLGINIGKNKITAAADASEDYSNTFELLHPWGDFFVINVSSPNTPGLRNLQSSGHLDAIFRSVQSLNQKLGAKPLLVKIAPDLNESQLDDILAQIEAHRLDGIVATNTTIEHGSVVLRETGGLSGAPMRKRSTEVIRLVHRKTKGKLPIIGVGGVFTADDFQEKLDAGASLVQAYTGFVYQGPWFAWQVVK